MRTALKQALKQPSLVIVALLSLALGFSLAANIYHHTPSPAIAAPTKDTALSDWRTVFEDISDKLAPSVVYITTETTVEVSNPMSGLDDFFNFGPFGGPRNAPETRKQTKRASGSGVIVRSDGYILTNNHVVAGADKVTVRLADGRKFNGKVLTDPRTDLALVKIDAKDLPAAQLADSDKVKVGQWSVAIGSPFGLRNTLTVGVVSAVRKEVDPEDPLPYPEVIQTDASINPGNSGGPLVNLDGRVIGINGAIYSTSGGNVGIGFAIPSNTAQFVMKQLIDKGKVVRGFLGVEMRDLTPSLGDKLGAKEGALVTSVVDDGAAAKAGLQVKDIIIKVDNQQISSGSELRHAVEKLAPGETVKMIVIRDKKEKTISVKLGEAPSGNDSASSSDGSDKTGMQVQPLTSDLAKQLGIGDGVQGVVVRKVDPGSAADHAGIQPKDVITEVDNTPVTSVATFSKAMSKLGSGDTALVVVQRGDRSVIVELQLD
ncbi:MAG: Do family serine endopeptidase [Armatimonadota bacterium]|nr:Do family serine endopeptidase [bacterium]